MGDVVLGGNGWPELIVGGEPNLGCSDMEVGDVYWVVGWFDLVVLGIISQSQDADTTGFVGGCSFIPDPTEFEVTKRI